MSKYSYQHSLDSWDWEKIPVEVDQVIIRWWAIVGERPPWTSMPADDRFGYMRSVVSELLNEARHPSDGLRERRLRRAAHTHGLFRRRQGCDAAVVAEEMVALGRAIEAAMVEGGHSSCQVHDYLVLLQVDARLASEFAARGWEWEAEP